MHPLLLSLLAASLTAPPQAPPIRERPAQAPPVVSEVTTPLRTFPVSRFVNGSYHSGHDCPNPNCDGEQTTIGDDTGPNHTHTCAKCGTTWHHVDAVSSGPNLKVVRRFFRRW